MYPKPLLLEGEVGMLPYNHKRFYSRTTLEFCCKFGSSHRFRRIKVYPKGNAEAKGDSLSVYLEGWN